MAWRELLKRTEDLDERSFRYKLWLGMTGIPPLDWLSDRYSTVERWFRSKYEMLGRMCFWAWKMRYSYDWDGHYVYDLLYDKLDRMQKTMSSDGNCVWNSSPEEPEYETMRKLIRAVELVKRIKDRDAHRYLEEFHQAHEEKWGQLESNFLNPAPEDKRENGTIVRMWRKNATTEEEKKQERLELRAIWNTDHEAREADKKELFDLLRDELDNWWD